MNPRAIRANKGSLVETDSRLSRGHPVSLLILPFHLSPFTGWLSSASSSSSHPRPRRLRQPPAARARGQTTRDTLLTLILLLAIPPPRENLRLSVLDSGNNHLQVSLIPLDRVGIPAVEPYTAGNFKTLPFH